MNSRAAWMVAASMAAAGIACGSNVTVEPTSAGGGGTGGESSTGDIGGGGNGGVAGGPGGMGGFGGAGGGPGGEGGGGAGGGPGGEGGGGAGGGLTCSGFGDPCTDCMSTGCAQTFCACADEPHCFGFLECLGTCAMGDTACFQNCTSVHQDGVSLGFLVSDCAATTCDGSCMIGQALMPCQKCLYTECAPEMNACFADPECIALIQCLQMCPPGSMTCGQGCITDHPEGLPEAQAVRDCRQANCTDSCP